jgi:hypothetical protein
MYGAGPACVDVSQSSISEAIPGADEEQPVIEATVCSNCAGVPTAPMPRSAPGLSPLRLVPARQQ